MFLLALLSARKYNDNILSWWHFSTRKLCHCIVAETFSSLVYFGFWRCWGFRVLPFQEEETGKESHIFVWYKINTQIESKATKPETKYHPNISSLVLASKLEQKAIMRSETLHKKISLDACVLVRPWDIIWRSLECLIPRIQKMPITDNHSANIKSQVVCCCALLIFFISHTQNRTSAEGRHGGHGTLYKVTSLNKVSTRVEVPGVWWFAEEEIRVGV